MNLQQLHSCYCTISGRQTSFAMCERDWYEFVKAGFSIDDLKLVLEWILRENRKHPAWNYSLMFSKVIRDLQRFDEYRAEARAAERNRRVITPREQVLQSFNPVVGEVAPNNVVSFKDALKKAVGNL